jgi:RNA polymerase primary sigma factor
MSDNLKSQQSGIKDLIAKGREQGYLTYAEVNDHLPEGIADPEQVDDIIQMINDMGITVFENAPDAESLLMISGLNTPDELAAAEAAAALASVESEQHRTTDPVRMYMREMGSVELLTREGEIEIAKRIEEGTRETMIAISDWPSAVSSIIEEWDRVSAGERKLTDLISGYLNPMENVPSALAQQQAAEAAAAEKIANGETVENEDSEDDYEGGLDPDEANRRFEEIRGLLIKTERCLARYGRDGKASKENLEQLANAFKYLKLTPRQLDPLIESIRNASDKIRTEERSIMRFCLRLAKMPRKDFIKNFPSNETNFDWVADLIKSDADYSDGLINQEQEIIRCQRKLSNLVAETGLTIAEIKDINRRVTMGEAMARRAKKEMVEANLRLVISIAKNIQIVAYNSLT